MHNFPMGTHLVSGCTWNKVPALATFHCGLWNETRLTGPIAQRNNMHHIGFKIRAVCYLLKVKLFIAQDLGDEGFHIAYQN